MLIAGFGHLLISPVTLAAKGSAIFSHGTAASAQHAY